jgi:hypothetical protein
VVFFVFFAAVFFVAFLAVFFLAAIVCSSFAWAEALKRSREIEGTIPMRIHTVKESAEEKML